jgi:hypothetical protein
VPATALLPRRRAGPARTAFAKESSAVRVVFLRRSAAADAKPVLSHCGVAQLMRVFQLRESALAEQRRIS